MAVINLSVDVEFDQDEITVEKAKSILTKKFDKFLDGLIRLSWNNGLGHDINITEQEITYEKWADEYMDPILNKFDFEDRYACYIEWKRNNPKLCHITN